MTHPGRPQSLSGKKWVIRGHTLGELMARNPDDASVTFHDPFLFTDMKKAALRVERAMAENERILVFGDYDVDGISGTAILVHSLRALGAHVSYRLPTRQDGYGINLKWIEEFIRLDVKVLITVDCGISNAHEIETATRAGMDVIITDHHVLPKRIPAAYAILHPGLPGDTYPFHELSGSAMAYKLAVGLMQHLGGAGVAGEWRTRLSDLASLGTVADCVPLTGENRWIVKTGLDQLRCTEWPGLKILLEKAGVEEMIGYDSDLIGFRIGPRLNASGRLETPTISLQVLLNENGAAARLADKLEVLNHDRRNQVDVAYEEAEAQIVAHGLSDRHVLALASEEWGAGIIGLLAARLSEKYHRPAMVMEHRGHELVGSCRSPEFFNMARALTACGDHLKTFGGHAAAAGFTISVERLPEFLEAMERIAAQTLKGRDFIPVLTIDQEITIAHITADLVRHLAELEPYGVGNERPRFLLRNAAPLDLQTVGREHRHLRFRVNPGGNGSGKGVSAEGLPKGGGRGFGAIAFRFGEHFATLQKAVYDEHRALDIVFEIERNVWQGRERIQLKVVDIKVV